MESKRVSIFYKKRFRRLLWNMKKTFVLQRTQQDYHRKVVLNAIFSIFSKIFILIFNILSTVIIFIILSRYFYQNIFLIQRNYRRKYWRGNKILYSVKRYWEHYYEIWRKFLTYSELNKTITERTITSKDKSCTESNISNWKKYFFNF